MKLSQYAKQTGVTYKTAYRWFKAGTLDAYQSATGLIIVRDKYDEKPVTGRISLYARVSSIGQKEDGDRQLHRLRRLRRCQRLPGLQRGERDCIRTRVTSVRNAQKLLADTSIGTIVVENRDRLTRFGSHSIETLLEAQGRHLEMIFPGDTGDELVDDFVSVITSMAARISGRRQSKRRAEKIKQCVEQAMKEED